MRPTEQTHPSLQPDWTATPADVGVRLDSFLAARLDGVSRTGVQQLIRAGDVVIDGTPARASTRLADGMRVHVTFRPPAPSLVAPESIPLSILHDDEDIVVVDKPAGMVVHPAAGHAGGTLVNALLHHVGGLSGIGGRERPGIVHRLDRGTSGVMVIAKHDRAHHVLAKQFHDRLVEKTYVALVWGSVDPERFESLIGRDRRHRQKMSSRTSSGRVAVTTIVEVEPLGGVTFTRLSISTGRTHQIRVHLSEAGHPIVGDELYGGIRKRVPASLASVNRLRRPFLHAQRLTFRHPADGRLLTFEAPLPGDLAGVLATLRRTGHQAPAS